VARGNLLARPSAIGAGFFAPAGAAEAVPAIAAADLNYALKEAAEHFTKDTGKEVKLAFGSSGNFSTQIRQGGPFEVFLIDRHDGLGLDVRAGAISSELPRPALGSRDRGRGINASNSRSLAYH